MSSEPVASCQVTPTMANDFVVVSGSAATTLPTWSCESPGPSSLPRADSPADCSTISGTACSSSCAFAGATVVESSTITSADPLEDSGARRLKDAMAARATATTAVRQNECQESIGEVRSCFRCYFCGWWELPRADALTITQKPQHSIFALNHQVLELTRRVCAPRHRRAGGP